MAMEPTISMMKATVTTMHWTKRMGQQHILFIINQCTTLVLKRLC